MIIREIQIENFRQITGNHRIQLALPGERCLTVILGENGAGKTTLLQACLWCLYEEADFQNPSELASYHALSSLAAGGGDVPVRVRLVFDANSRRYSAERKIVITRGSEGTQTVSEPEFNLFFTDSTGETRPSDDPREEVRRLLPRELAGFFFFRGEDLDQLVAQSGADKLQSAVEEFIDLKLVDRSIHHLDEAVKVFERQLKGQVSGEAKKLTAEIERHQSDLESLNAKYDNQQAKRNKLAEQYESIENQLRQFQEIQPLIERKRELTREIAGLEESIASQTREVARIVSRHGFLWLNPQVLTETKRLTKEAVQTGELPAKIKPQFVDDLLAEEKCICGREIGYAETDILRRWKSENHLAAIETAILQLRNAVGSMDTRVEQFESDLEGARDQLVELKDQKQRCVAERSQIAGDLEGSKTFEVDVRKLQALLAETSTNQNDLSYDIGITANRRDDLKQRVDNKVKLRDAAASKQEEGKLTSRRAMAARRVSAAFAEIRQGWVGLVQQYLDVELKRNWKEMAQLDRLVSFDSKFRLSIKERDADGDWVASATSAANQRALALDFVASVIRLASDASRASDSMLFAGGDYPLMMDAPFATMDEHFKSTVPKGLLEAVPQLVILNSLDQWQGTVANGLTGAVGRVYVLELHGPAVQTKTAQFGGSTFAYKVEEKDAAYDWTVIREVEL